MRKTSDIKISQAGQEQLKPGENICDNGGWSSAGIEMALITDLIKSEQSFSQMNAFCQLKITILNCLA